MKKKRLFYVVFLVLLLPFIYAEDEDKEEIYSGTFEHAGETTIGGEKFIFSITNIDKVYFKLPSGSGIVVPNQSCELIEDYDICVEDIIWSSYDAMLEQDFYEASIKIYEFFADAADLALTREITNTDILIGETTDITVNIKNDGKKKATNVVYSDPIPSIFTIRRVDDCVLEKTNADLNTIKWTGSLNINQEITCYYILLAQNQTTFESKASIKYDNGVEIITTDSETKTITVQEYQIRISHNLSNLTVNVNEEFTLNINLINVNEDSEIKVNPFNLVIPPNLEIVSYSRKLVKNGRELKWDHTLRAGDSISFDFTLKGLFARNYTLKPKAKFTINNKVKENEQIITINIEGGKVYISPKFSDKILSSEKSSIKVEAINPSSDSSFEDLVLTIESSLPDFNTVVNELGDINTLKSLVIENIPFTAPTVVVDTNYTFTFSLSYTSEHGQILSTKHEETITVIGKDLPDVNETEIVVDLSEEKEEKGGAVSKVLSSTSKIINQTIQLKENMKPEEFYIIIGVVFIGLIISIILIVHKVRYG